DGSFTYIHEDSPARNVTFTYRAFDGTDFGNLATVTIIANDRPLAIDDFFRVLRGGTITIAAPGIVENDLDGDGDALSAVLVTGTSHGSLTWDADGSFTYRHDTYNLLNAAATSDYFTYRARDAFVESNLAVVSITIGAPPTADDNMYDVVCG